MTNKYSAARARTAVLEALDTVDITDPNLRHRGDSYEFLVDLRKQLQHQGAEIRDEDWENTSLIGKKDMLETAARNLYGDLAVEARTDDIETRVSGLGQPAAPVQSTEDMITEAYERGLREANPEAARDRIREGMRSGAVVSTYRNGQPVPYSFGSAPAGAKPDPYADAFRAWMANGEHRMSDKDREILRTGYTTFEGDLRALGATGTGAAGAYLVPTELQRRVISKLASYSGIYDSGRATEVNSRDGRPLQIPTLDDTGQYGEVVAENADVGSIVDPSFAQVALPVRTYTSKPLRVSWQMLADNGIDGFEGFIADLLATRIGRRLAQHLINGDPGASPAQPEGLLRNIVTGVTTTSPTAITYDELVDMTMSVDQAYQTSAAWLAQNSFKALVGKLKDTAGNPIWSDARGGMPAELLGYPVVFDANMPAVAATAKAAVFGDLSNFAIRRAEMFLLRLTERYSELGQVGFLMFARFGAVPLISGGYKALVMHA